MSRRETYNGIRDIGKIRRSLYPYVSFSCDTNFGGGQQMEKSLKLLCQFRLSRLEKSFDV